MAKRAVMASLVLHLLVGVVLARMSVRVHPPASAGQVAIDLVGDERSPPPPSKASPPAAPARANAPVAAVRPRPPAHSPIAPDARSQPAAEPAAAVDTGLELGNRSGDGVTLPARRAPAPAGESPPPPHRREPPKLDLPAPSPAGDCRAPDTRPQPVEKTTIEYTREAQTSGVEGQLLLTLHVAVDGSVAGVDVTRSVEPSLDAAAVAAVRGWRFRPATHCGKPIGEGLFTVKRTFELGN